MADDLIQCAPFGEAARMEGRRACGAHVTPDVGWDHRNRTAAGRPSVGMTVDANFFPNPLKYEISIILVLRPSENWTIAGVRHATMRLNQRGVATIGLGEREKTRETSRQWNESRDYLTLIVDRGGGETHDE